MPTIIHSTDGGSALSDVGLPASGGLVILAAPEGAVLPDEAGVIGGRIMRLRYLSSTPSACRVLADCARILSAIDAAAGEALEYRLAGAEEASLDTSAEIFWHARSDGSVTAFRLSAMAAGDPLLPVLTAELAEKPLTDDRRFSFLAAALAVPALPESE